MNTINLDSLESIRNLDSQNMLGSIIELPLQVKQTWGEIQSMDIPQDYSNVENIVFSGMGGSALGAYVLKNLYGSMLTVPFEIVNDYNLPAYVSDKSLVIVQSYSGTTEETLHCMNQAIERKAKLYTISAGGELETLAREHNSVYYKINPEHNPSNQPRMAIGYSIFALLAFFNKLGFITIHQNELSEIQEVLDQNNHTYGQQAPTEGNMLKQLAWNIYDRIPVLIAAEHLVGSIHAARNQINENAKSLAVYFPLPELNHHLLEGLVFPKGTRDSDFYVLFASSLYSEKLQIRLKATKETIDQLLHNTAVIDVPGSSRLTQVIAAIHLGSYLGYYLAMINGIDPSPIPQVEGFKKKIAHVV